VQELRYLNIANSPWLARPAHRSSTNTYREKALLGEVDRILSGISGILWKATFKNWMEKLVLVAAHRGRYDSVPNNYFASL
jgi:hypothetical protein